jgi:glutathione synthase/RimK-type ligase-like ATP-grasp enzyme
MFAIKVFGYKLYRRFLRGRRVAILGNGTEAYDDLMLCFGFIAQGVYAEIVDYRKIAITDFDVFIVKSVWGYHKDIEGFLGLVGDIERSGKKLVNELSVLKRNLSKAEQSRFLARHRILMPKTRVSGDYSEFLKAKGDFPEGFVLKLAISAGSENIFIADKGSMSGVRQYFNQNTGKEILLQEYFPEVLRGEISVIVVAGKVLYGVLRLNKMFNGGKYEIRQITIPRGARETAQKIISSREYAGAVYLRVDMVVRHGEFYVLEVEAIEPALFFYALGKRERRKVIAAFVKGVLG